MILLLGIPDAVARGLARGLAAEGEPVEIDQADMSSMREVRRRVLEKKPRALVVTGGLDDPGACEADPDRAFRLNAENIIHAAAAALELKIPPILLSTGEVFGERGGPWIESDTPSPPSSWARSRLQGETFLLRTSKDAIVVRTGPLLSEELEAERALFAGDALEAADDERVSPIAASELGAVIAWLVRGSARGLFHAAPPDEPVSRAEHLMAVARALGVGEGRVRGRPAREIVRPAALSRSAALASAKLGGYLQRPLSSWREALAVRRDPLVPRVEAQPAVEREEVRMGHKQDVRRVEKPWGHEIIWAHSDRYVGKVLFIKAGERLSLQYHQKKDETVYVLSGKMVFEFGPKDGAREDLILRSGEAFHITPSTVHRMIAIEDTTVLEASTTEIDDVVRLEDKYGRAGTSQP